MKTFKVIICAIFVLCCGAFLTACNEKNFNEAKILVGESQFVYDGESHIVDIDYKGVNAKVTYALASNKNNFKSLDKFNFVNAGTYKLYYRLSANGYNTYTSNGYLELKIVPRELEVSIFDYTLMKSNQSTDIFLGHSYYGAVEGDDLGLEFTYGEDFDMENLEYGDVYDISCTIDNPNYNLIINRTAKLTVADYVHIDNGDGSVSYYSTLQDAIDVAEDGDTLYLNDNIVVNEAIEVDKSVVIDGQGYSITANPTFTSTDYEDKTLTSVINVFNSDVDLTLTNVTIDGNKVARGVSMFNGKLTLDLATVTNGKKTDEFLSGGVYVADDASFVMSSGYIGNNDSNDYEYTRYCSDLYIGITNASSVATISGGRVDNVFVDSNENSATGVGKLTLNGGQIYNIYVEYNNGYGAMFEYQTGEVSNLMISLTSEVGNYVEVTADEGTTYIGGNDYTNE